MAKPAPDACCASACALYTRLSRNDYLEIFSLLTFCTFAMICLISGFPDLWDSTFNGGGSQHLGAGSPFDGSGSQVVDLKSEVPERRSGPCN